MASFIFFFFSLYDGGEAPSDISFHYDFEETSTILAVALI